MKRIAYLILAISTVFLTSCGYNTIIQNDEGVNASFGDLQASYQRRMDLIPSLVSTVKAYASHEKDTLSAVIEARSKAGSMQMTPELANDPQAMKNFQQAQSQMGSALSRLMVIVEKYPDLKADQSFRDLQNQLEGTENRINVARVRYNDSVRIFNTSIRTFPNNITNNFMLKLQQKQPFAADEAAQKAPVVNFD